MLSDLSPTHEYRRPRHGSLVARPGETRRYIQVVAGPSRVGKTTLVQQALADLDTRSVCASADDPGIRDRASVDAKWGATTAVAATEAGGKVILGDVDNIRSES